MGANPFFWGGIRWPIPESSMPERDAHFGLEELLAHMCLPSSEAKDWKSRVVSEAEQVLVREFC